MFDDKLRILAAMKTVLRDRLTTVGKTLDPDLLQKMDAEIRAWKWTG